MAKNYIAFLQCHSDTGNAPLLVMAMTLRQPTRGAVFEFNPSTGSNRRGLDRLGALERRTGETAVYIGAQRRPRRNKLKDIDPEMKI
jgi:hypothetical protein